MPDTNSKDRANATGLKGLSTQMQARLFSNAHSPLKAAATQAQVTSQQQEQASENQKVSSDSTNNLTLDEIRLRATSSSMSGNSSTIDIANTGSVVDNSVDSERDVTAAADLSLEDASNTATVGSITSAHSCGPNGTSSGDIILAPPEPIPERVIETCARSQTYGLSLELLKSLGVDLPLVPEILVTNVSCTLVGYLRSLRAT